MVDAFKKKAIDLIDGYSPKSKEIVNKLLNKIVSQLIKDKSLNEKRKITLTLQLWREMSKEQLFRKNSVLANKFSFDLIEHRIISKSSKVYPRNIKFLSANPLSSAFLHGKLQEYDRVLDVRDDLIKTGKEDVLLAIFIYLRAFHLEPIPVKHFKYIMHKHIYTPGRKTLFIFHEIKKEGEVKKEVFSPIYTYYLDENIVAMLQGYMCNNEPLFLEANIKEYEKKSNKVLKNILPSLSLHDIRKIIQLEYQLHHSPLDLTLKTAKQYPKLHIAEIEYLFPQSMPKELLKLEQENILWYKNIYKEDIKDVYEEDKPRISVTEYLNKDFEIYDELKKILNVPYEKREFKKYLTKWYKYIDKVSSKEEGMMLSIIEFTATLLDKANPHEVTKPIQPKTLKEYLRISFQYAFKYMIVEGDINEEALKNIEIGIIYNDKLTLPTQRKYKRIINLFIRTKTSFNTLNKIQSAVHINRSLIFKEELDKCVKILVRLDSKGLKRKTSSNYVCMYQRAVFAMLLYYSGARKNELRTRLTRDIVEIDDNTFSLDINIAGVKAQKSAEYDKGGGLKSIAAKRRIRFQIYDKKHAEILIRYLHKVEKKGSKFLFPKTKRKQKSIKVYKKMLIPENNLDDIGKVLQNITHRYTPLHSLRHSYITNKVKYMSDGVKKRVEDMFEVSTQAGHSSPEVTIEWYLHVGILKMMLDDF